MLPTLSFDDAVRVVLAQEGGYANRPRDKGGPTNMGITHRTLAQWRRVDEVTADEVKALTLVEAVAIYRANFWGVLRADRMPAAIALLAFDFGVNSGPRRAAEHLQRLLGVNDDGWVGEVTLGALAAVQPNHLGRLVDDYAGARIDYLRTLEDFPVFKGGWVRRVDEVRIAALPYLPETGVAPPDPPPLPVALTPRDLARLQGVHPDLVRVVRRARLTSQFMVIEGLRTPERQRQLVAAGASQTLNSRHLTGHAVDLGVLFGGTVSWDVPRYRTLAAVVREAAAAERVPVEWGGDFRGFFDGPHFQLPWKGYP